MPRRHKKTVENINSVMHSLVCYKEKHTKEKPPEEQSKTLMMASSPLDWLALKGQHCLESSLLENNANLQVKFNQ